MKQIFNNPSFGNSLFIHVEYCHQNFFFNGKKNPKYILAYQRMGFNNASSQVVSFGQTYPCTPCPQPLPPSFLQRQLLVLSPPMFFISYVVLLSPIIIFTLLQDHVASLCTLHFCQSFHVSLFLNPLQPTVCLKLLCIQHLTFELSSS